MKHVMNAFVTKGGFAVWTFLSAMTKIWVISIQSAAIQVTLLFCSLGTEKQGLAQICRFNNSRYVTPVVYSAIMSQQLFRKCCWGSLRWSFPIKSEEMRIKGKMFDSKCVVKHFGSGLLILPASSCAEWVSLCLLHRQGLLTPAVLLSLQGERKNEKFPPVIETVRGKSGRSGSALAFKETCSCSAQYSVRCELKKD